MTKLRKIGVGLGLVVAPFLYLAGRTLSSKTLYQMALTADPGYLRAYLGTAYPGHSRLHVAQLNIAAKLASKINPKWSERLKEMLSVAESQLLQDVFCALTLNEKEQGYFVEVGVGAGRTISNTYMLEKHYGWTGLLVEPNRSSHASIEACRTANLERRAAASESGKILRFQEVIGAGEHSRVAGTGGHTIHDSEIVEYDVETVSLTEILTQNQAPREIDYLSLDTEGSEIDILCGIDFNKFIFKVITIEHNYDREIQNNIEKILAPLGYRRVLYDVSEFDAWYIHCNMNVEGIGWM